MSIWWLLVIVPVSAAVGGAITFVAIDKLVLSTFFRK